MKTNGDIFREHADKMGIPRRTLEQVQACIADCRARAKGSNVNLDASMAHLMLKAGRLQPDAYAWLEREYPQ